MSTNQKTMRVGLGEAIKRVLFLSAKKFGNAASPSELEELKLLMSALDTIPLDLGFDCNGDDVPDTIEIFTQTANTSCCRMVDIDLKEAPKAKEKRKTKKVSAPKKSSRSSRGSRG